MISTLVVETIVIQTSAWFYEIQSAGVVKSIFQKGVPRSPCKPALWDMAYMISVLFSLHRDPRQTPVPPPPSTPLSIEHTPKIEEALSRIPTAFPFQPPSHGGQGAQLSTESKARGDVSC